MSAIARHQMQPSLLPVSHRSRLATGVELFLVHGKSLLAHELAGVEEREFEITLLAKRVIGTHLKVEVNGGEIVAIYDEAELGWDLEEAGLSAGRALWGSHCAGMCDCVL